MPTNWSPQLTIAGEYGATRVQLSKDGSCFRLAFGRNANDGRTEGACYFHGAVILSPEAIEELKSQIAELGV